VLLVGLAALALWKLPELQVAPARERLAAEESLSASERLLLDKELFQAENAARSTLALILGAAGLLIGLSAAWRRVEAGREARSQERFGQAIEQLASERGDGSPRTETRLGGIYALERIAAESEKDFWPVMEVLTAYVRENAAWERTPGRQSNASSEHQSRLGADIQAIMGVLGRRRASFAGGERRLLDLRETDLHGANLSGARLEGVTLQGAHLERADATRAALSRANLREAELGSAVMSGADLEGAALARANLEGARLNGANLKGADLSGANLRGVDLWEANLKGCNLRDADLRGADLSQALLQEAILWRADLQEATLTGARLKDTHLERANLSGAVGLTWEQGEDAYTDENTLLPDYLNPTQPPQPVYSVPAASTSAARAGGGSRPAGAGTSDRPARRPARAARTGATARSRAGAAPSTSKRAAATTRGTAQRKPKSQLSSQSENTAANVVELQAAIRTAARKQSAASAASKKKLARPRERKQALVEPA
jgi:uncharacterized protein YjbI with pentapeptide repeats